MAVRVRMSARWSGFWFDPDQNAVTVGLEQAHPARHLPAGPFVQAPVDHQHDGRAGMVGVFGESVSIRSVCAAADDRFPIPLRAFFRGIDRRALPASPKLIRWHPAPAGRYDDPGSGIHFLPSEVCHDAR